MCYLLGRERPIRTMFNFPIHISRFHLFLLPSFLLWICRVADSTTLLTLTVFMELLRPTAREGYAGTCARAAKRFCSPRPTPNHNGSIQAVAHAHVRQRDFVLPLQLQIITAGY